MRNVRLGKESLILTAVRLTASTWRDDAWVHPGLEEGILLIRVDLTAAPAAGVNIVGCPLVAFSTHAIARRIQRGVGRDHASIMRSIADCLRARLQTEAMVWQHCVGANCLRRGPRIRVPDICRSFVGGLANHMEN